MSAPMEDCDARLHRRAANALGTPGAFLSEETGGYALRTSGDRRRRPLLRLDETVFRALTKEPGLKPRAGGGWSIARQPAPEPPKPDPGRPGFVRGRRRVVQPDGSVLTVQANLGESAIAWLARRKGPGGRPWLSAKEVAAAERLQADYDCAGVIGRLTSDWNAGPRSGFGGSRLEPVERARAAKDRIAAALAEVGPGLAEMLERVCFLGSALQAAERELGLMRGSGKVVLKLALARLATHYGL